MTPIEAGENILKCLDYIISTYETNLSQIENLQNQEQDIRHQIEFTPLDIQRGYKFAKQMQIVRQERRKCKDDNELLNHLYKYLTTGNANAFKNGLINALERARVRSKQLESRKYGCRTEQGEQVYKEIMGLEE